MPFNAPTLEGRPAHRPSPADFHQIPEPLSTLGLEIYDHWMEHRPRMCAELQKQGKLLQSVYAAQNLTAEALFEAMQGPAKLPYNRAWELVRGEWAFLPDEED